VAAHLLHTPPPLAVRGFTRRCKNPGKRAGLAELLLLFPSLPAVRIPITCKKEKNTQMAVDFISFFFRFVSVSFWICFPAGPSLVSVFSSASGSCQQGGGMGSGCGFAGGAAVSPLQ
jgi:hypothetical protein